MEVTQEHICNKIRVSSFNSSGYLFILGVHTKSRLHIKFLLQ